MNASLDHHLIVDPKNITFDNAVVLLDYWNLKRGARPRPCWSDLDLMDIYAIAPLITVKDAVDGGAEFRNRFYGSELTNILGYDGTGKLLADNYSGEGLALVMKSCGTAFESLKPMQSNGQIVWAEGREYRNYSCLYLPLDDTPGTPAHLISVFDFDVF